MRRDEPWAKAMVLGAVRQTEVQNLAMLCIQRVVVAHLAGGWRRKIVRLILPLLEEMISQDIGLCLSLGPLACATDNKTAPVLTPLSFSFGRQTPKPG